MERVGDNKEGYPNMDERGMDAEEYHKWWSLEEQAMNI